MNSLFSYLLQMIIISGLLYGYYHLILRNKKFHQYNRYFLLLSIVISLTLPLINIPLYYPTTETGSNIVIETLDAITVSTTELNLPKLVVEPGSNSGWNWNKILNTCYCFISFLVVLRLILSLINIRKIITRNAVIIAGKINFIVTSEPGTPYSFFNWLFWNKEIDIESEKGRQILRHETFHIQQKHSIDIVLIELLLVLFWINPFFLLIKKELKAIHEFLADEFASSNDQQWKYAELLLMHSMQTNQRLVNPFFQNQIKRRVKMIISSDKTSYRYFRKIMILPFAFILFVLFAFSYQQKFKVEAGSIMEHITHKDNIQLPRNISLSKTEMPADTSALIINNSVPEIDTTKWTLFIQNKTMFRDVSEEMEVRLDPNILYIGVDNWLVVTNPSRNLDDVDISVSQGSVFRWANNMVIRVTSVQDDLRIKFHLKNTKILVAELSFPVRAISTDIIHVKKVDRIALNPVKLEEFKSFSVNQLLKAPPDVKVVSWIFTLETKGMTSTVFVSDISLIEHVTKLIADVKPGEIVRINQIQVESKGELKSIPSVFWSIVE